MGEGICLKGAYLQELILQVHVHTFSDGSKNVDKCTTMLKYNIH